MSPSEGPVKELDEKNMGLVVKFIADVRTGKLDGSNKLACETVNLLEQIINESENATGLWLSSVVRQVGETLGAALPEQLVATNMVRRVLRAIRDEGRVSQHYTGGGEGAGESLQQLVLAAPRAPVRLATGADLRPQLREHLAELRSELETSSLVSQAAALLAAGEVVLAYSASRRVERTLRRTPPAHVLLVEGARRRECHAMAARLTASGSHVSVITTAAVFGLMPQVDKVLVSARCVLGGGAVLGEAGLRTVTAAATHYQVPVIVLCPLYKLCPLYASQQARLDNLTAPNRALPYEVCAAGASVLSPSHDLVPPEHVSLFITNLGGSSPSYIYRLLSELYDPSDYQL